MMGRMGELCWDDEDNVQVPGLYFFVDYDFHLRS